MKPDPSLKAVISLGSRESYVFLDLPWGLCCSQQCVLKLRFPFSSQCPMRIRRPLAAREPSSQALDCWWATWNPTPPSGFELREVNRRLQPFTLPFPVNFSISHFCGVMLPQWLRGWRICLQCWRWRRCRFNPWVRKIPWRRKWQPTAVFWSGKSHGWRSLAGYSPWGHKRLDTTEWLSMHTPLNKESPIFSLCKEILPLPRIIKSKQLPHSLWHQMSGFFTTASWLAPAEWPTIQFSSDTVHLKLAPDLEG